jgi:hypothetical protein
MFGLAGIGRMCAAMEVVWVRYGAHLLLMLVLWAPVRPARLVRTRRPGLHAVRAVTMLGLPVFYLLTIAAGALTACWWLVP